MKPIDYGAILVWVLLLAASGCTRLGHRMLIDSRPPGAGVSVNGALLGRTPLVFHEDGRNDSFTFLLQKEGYRSAEALLNIAPPEGKTAENWGLLWKIPGVRRIDSLPDRVTFLLLREGPPLSLLIERGRSMALIRTNPETLAPELTLRIGYGLEFESALRESLNPEGNLLYFEIIPHQTTTLSSRISFIQGEMVYEPDPQSVTEMGGFQVVSDGSGGESEAVLYRPLKDSLTVGEGEGRSGWISLPAAFDISRPMGVRWEGVGGVTTFKEEGVISGVGEDGSLVLSGGRRVRLGGVMVMRRGGEPSPEAVEYLRRFIGKRVVLEPAEREMDRTGTPLVYIHSEGRLLNEVMVAKGLARPLMGSEYSLYREEMIRSFLEAMSARKMRGGARSESLAFAEPSRRMLLPAESAASPTPSAAEGGNRGQPLIRNRTKNTINLRGYSVITGGGARYPFVGEDLGPGEALELERAIGYGETEESGLSREGSLYLLDVDGGLLDVYNYAAASEGGAWAPQDFISLP